MASERSMVSVGTAVSLMDVNSRDSSPRHIGHSTDVGSPSRIKHVEVI